MVHFVLVERRRLMENRESGKIRDAYDNLPSFEIPSKLHKVKKLDVFEKVITKIVDIAVDKIVIAIPIVIRKLFGITIENLNDYNPSYSYGNYGSVQSLKDLGIFGYLPLIILKFIDGFTYFVNILKRNKFVKTFLVPASVLAGILGFIVFLIWWLQPNDYNNPYGYLSYEDKQYNNDYNNLYNTQSSYDSRAAIKRLHYE